MRDFLKYTLATFAGIVLFCTLSVAGLTALLIAIASSSRDAGPQVEKGSILTFDLSQEITDSTPSADPSKVINLALSGGSPGGNSVPLRTVLQALEGAAKDNRIAGLYLYSSVNPTGIGSGYATLREVRQALQAFRDSGKPIYAYDTADWKERDYYLASVADHILLSPTGVVEINGLSLETTFFGGAFQKYGVGVQAIRVGKYKSAVEPYTRISSSPEAKAESQTLLSDVWSEFLAAASKSRKLTPQQLQAIADKQGMLLPDQAKAAGLIDKVAYEDEVVTALQGVTGEKQEEKDSFRQIDVADYAQVHERDTKRSSARHVAVVYAEGEIVSGGGGPTSIGGDTLTELLQELRKNDDVKAVVLRVNSPGGSATASAQIAREVFLINQKKPVIVSMGSYAASGGYQISMNAKRIFASPTTITGSIGVFGLLPNFQKLANSNGITWDVVKTGRFADIDTVSRPKNAAELAVQQRMVDRIYDQFISSVASSRSISKQRVAEIAQGRVWSGTEAKKIGLVDELGGLDAAIQAAAKQANLGDDWQLEEYPKSSSLEKQLLGKLFSSRLAQASAPPDPVTQEIQALKEDWETLRSMNDPLGAYSRLPFNPRIE